MLKWIFISCIALLNLTGTAQDGDIMSFKELIKTIPADSSFKLIDKEIYNLDSMDAPNEQKMEVLRVKAYLADSTQNQVQRLNAYKNLLRYKPLLTAREIFDFNKRLGNSLIKIGSVGEGVEAYFNAAFVADSIQNDTLLADIYRIIGTRYKNSNEINLSLKYLNESLILNEQLFDTIGIINCYMTIGNAYKGGKIFDSAFVYYDKSLTLCEEIDYNRGRAGNYNNIGSAYLGIKKYDEALEHFFLALEINQADDNERWVSYNYNNIGNAYDEMGKYKEALIYYQKSMDIKERNGDKEFSYKTLQNISMVHAQLGNYKAAYNALQEHLTLSNKFENAERLKMASELEARFQNDKNEVEISRLKTEQKLQDVVISGQRKDLDHQKEVRANNRNLIYALAVILLSLIGTVVIFWRNNRQRKKHTEVLTAKNAEIETAYSEIDTAKGNLEIKNQEITDSINYAKRIQAAILPSEKTLASHLNEAFVLYLPKDIVAGDFYWTEKVGDTILFAVADCTGHGVPGALVSVICHNALNTAIKQMELTDPGEILDETTRLVLEKFSKSEEEVKDGMDIALCSFNQTTRELRFAGANTPLWVVRGEEVLKYKGTRQPVGNFAAERVNFESNVIPVQKGDYVYLSSDGFADQFGGIKGKKYLNKRFKELLVRITKLKISDQKSVLKREFELWKDTYEQVDDVCVLGAMVDN